MSNISVLWWNVHNLKNSEHAARVVAHVKESNPDIFALGEVVGEAAYRLIAKEFPQHNFYMTFGKQSQEMLVGVRRTMQVFFSQRTEFQSGNEFLRPAALITISVGEPALNILFGHLKSFSEPLDLGFRDEFFKRLGRLKHTLDDLSAGNSRFIACGDFNIQGMRYLGRKFIAPSDEFNNIKNELNGAGLFFAESDHYATWINKSDHRTEARLDYVAATQAVQIVSQGRNEEGDYKVHVGGWPIFPGGSLERNEFINSVSDHASLYFEITTT